VFFVFANQIQLLDPVVQAGLVIPVDVVVRDLGRRLAFANLFIGTRIKTNVSRALKVRHQFVVAETVLHKAE